jgi:phosphoketolase
MIVKHDLDVIFVAGPGHGAPGNIQHSAGVLI